MNSRRVVLADILGHAERNGLYRFPDAEPMAAAVRLPGRQLTNKMAMIDAVADALAFPDYFGRNWDALEECLLDLSWRPGSLVLLIDNAQVPEQRAPADWREFLEILHDAARFWKKEGRVFSVFLQGSHAAWPRVEPV